MNTDSFGAAPASSLLHTECTMRGQTTRVGPSPGPGSSHAMSAMVVSVFPNPISSASRPPAGRRGATFCSPGCPAPKTVFVSKFRHPPATGSHSRASGAPPLAETLRPTASARRSHHNALRWWSSSGTVTCRGWSASGIAAYSPAPPRSVPRASSTCSLSSFFCLPRTIPAGGLNSA